MNYNFERSVETDFMAALTVAAVTAVATPRHWKDGSTAASYPAAVVYCSGAGAAPESVDSLPIMEATIEVGAWTHVRADKDGSAASTLLALLRTELLKPTLLATLNAVSSYVYNDVRLRGSVNEIDTDNINQKSITIEAYFTLVST